MQTRRRWVPPPAGPSARTAPRGAPGLITDGDLAFCAEFEAGGGTAAAAQGFADERELLRMERAGLLDLRRSGQAPYAVTWVGLSAGARLMLVRGRQAAGMESPAEGQASAPAPGPDAGAEGGTAARRHGFETARGMIAAAVKAELSAAGCAAGPAVTARLLERISRMPVPF